MNLNVLLLTIAISGLGMSALSTAYAEETTKEKAQETGDKTAKAFKKVGRNIEDQTCMESDAKCLAKKAKHKVQNGADSIDTKAKELKNKAD
jgi:hypothetical protein